MSRNEATTYSGSRAACAAACLGNAITSRPQKPLDFANLGRGIALGRHDAIDFNNFPDDRAKWPYVTGARGFMGREFFVDLLVRLPGIERRLPGLHFWPGRGRIGKGATTQPQLSPKRDRPQATTSSSLQGR